MTKGTRAGIAAVCGMAIAGVLGFYLLFDSGSPSHAASASASAAPPTHESSAAAPSDTMARDFLARWSRGDAAGAGRDTTSPAAATAALRELDQDLPVTGLRASATGPVSATGVMPVQVVVSLRNLPTWTYQTSLDVLADQGHWPVEWTPQVINPQLADGARLALGSSPPPAGGFADRDGEPLTSAGHPALANMLGTLAKDRSLWSSGVPGTAVRVVNRATGSVDATLAQLVAPKPPPAVRLTIDTRIQDAAEQAIGSAPTGSGVVVEQPSTGDILAIANNPEDGYDTALLAKLAPGSAMKVVTSAALLARGVSPDQQVPCVPTQTVDGYTFHNEDGLTRSGTTLSDDFALSCNTAFISLREQVPGSSLHDEAADVFGLTEPWDIGLGQPATYGSVPPPTDSVTQAADLIGQGQVTMSPLAMASMAATVESGAFRQPVLRAGVSGYQPPGQLPSSADGSLRAMMRQVVTDGTAAPPLSSLPGYVGAKTGSAQVNGQIANGWLIAFDGDVAVGCVAQAGGSGAGAAGPVVRDILATAG